MGAGDLKKCLFFQSGYCANRANTRLKLAGLGAANGGTNSGRRAQPKQWPLLGLRREIFNDAFDGNIASKSDFVFLFGGQPKCLMAIGIERQH